MTMQRCALIDGVRYVRTGDLQKWDADNNLVHVSRVDYQIKLRGQRLEPAEIEHVIMSASSDIRECLVVKGEREEKDYLIAYLASTVSPSEEQNFTMLAEQACYSRLPAIKCPAIYLIWHEDKLPRTPNGKIDRSALPAPSFSTVQSNDVMNCLNKFNLPTESEIQQLWQHILHINGKQSKYEMSPDANWYQLGGDSLQLMKLISVYQRYLARDRFELPMAELLKHATTQAHTQTLNNTFKAYHQDSDGHITQAAKLIKTQATKGTVVVYCNHRYVVLVGNTYTLQAIRIATDRSFEVFRIILLCSLLIALIDII